MVLGRFEYNLHIYMIMMWEGSPKGFDHWFGQPFCFRIQPLKTEREQISLITEILVTIPNNSCLNRLYIRAGESQGISEP
jgi:hypothetical protein